MMAALEPARRPTFLSFGYLPSGVWKQDLRYRLLGCPNLLKRLQARDIMAALGIESTDTVLDFGCGAGYITVEMAKLAKKAVGIDINPFVESIVVPNSLAGRLEFRKSDGGDLPFEDGTFDRILASEVLPMISDASAFLHEIRRVMTPGGRLVVVNGVGHPVIRDSYLSRSPKLRALQERYPERFPPTYEEYCARFQKIAGTAREDFMSQDEVVSLLEKEKFSIDKVSHSPTWQAGAWMSWRQFELYLQSGKVVATKGFFLPFARFTLASLVNGRGYPGHLIVVARRS